jgi:hypothetical protein
VFLLANETRSLPPPHAGCPRGDPGPLSVLISLRGSFVYFCAKLLSPVHRENFTSNFEIVTLFMSPGWTCFCGREKGSDRERQETSYLRYSSTKTALRGTRVAMYIVGQEETVGESSVSVVAGVRTVTTNMNGRDALPRLSRPFAFLAALKFQTMNWQ